MPANTAPIFPVTPFNALANLSAQTACTTRAPTASAGLAAANIIALVPVGSANGRKIDTIRVCASSTSMTAPTAAMVIGIWLFDGTTATLQYEIQVDAITPSTTSISYQSELNIPNLTLTATQGLYVSTSVTTTAATTALTVRASGGDY